MDSLRRSRDFLRVFRSGKRRRCTHFTVYLLGNTSGSSRLGLTVSRKTGNAVVRNRIKRVLREAVRLAIKDLDHDGRNLSGYDIVVVPGRNCMETKPREISNQLKDALKLLS